MELQELRDILTQVSDRNVENAKGIYLKTGHPYDPFQQIKKRCLWVLLIFAGTTAIFFPFLIEKKNILFVILYLILSVESIISLTGYLQIKSLEQATGNIKQKLVIRIRRLNSIFRSYIFINAFFYILLAFSLEYMMRNHFITGFGFEKVAFPVRLVFYLGFIALQYLQKRWSFRKNHGSYLSSMMDILKQTHEE